MDCPSEENLIRMQLQELQSVKNLEFDISNRKLTVYHLTDLEKITKKLAQLNLGSVYISTETSTKNTFSENKNQKKFLWIVLSINVVFFLIEITTGWLSKSMGLVADSLDMLADSFVYAISLFAVGGTILLKKRVAKFAGYIQIVLAILGFMEVIRRFLNPSFPNFYMMIIVSVFALLANSICLYILQKSKSDEAHIQASMIFTSNDIIINLGVILAGILVHFLHSNIPDLLIGSMVFILVLQGAYRILKISIL